MDRWILLASLVMLVVVYWWLIPSAYMRLWGNGP